MSFFFSLSLSFFEKKNSLDAPLSVDSPEDELSSELAGVGVGVSVEPEAEDGYREQALVEHL